MKCMEGKVINLKDYLLDQAIDFIVETQENNEYICEYNGEWCETHCIDTLRKECVVYYLTNVYKKGQL